MTCPARRLSCIVPQEKEGRTVKSLLKSEFHMAEGFIAAVKLRPDGILLDGERVFTTSHVRVGEVLSVRVDDGERENTAQPVPLPIVIRYEDEDLAVLEKPAGMVVHGPEGRGVPTLANALAAHWGREQPFHPVHRLDRGTSGLMLVSKSAYVCELLRCSLHTEAFVREYLALTEGIVSPERGQIDLPIGPMDGERLRRCVRSDGQRALTFYETEAGFPGGSVLRLRLDTGRTHQIRVHLAALGHPLFGDAFYGGPSAEELARPALHAAFLRLRQPITGEWLEFASPLPEDLQCFLDKRKAPITKRREQS